MKNHYKMYYPEFKDVEMACITIENGILNIMAEGTKL